MYDLSACTLSVLYGLEVLWLGNVCPYFIGGQYLEDHGILELGERSVQDWVIYIGPAGQKMGTATSHTP